MDITQIVKPHAETIQTEFYDCPYQEFQYVGDYRGRDFRVFWKRYDYEDDVRLVCADRADCFNKESQCPIQFLTNLHILDQWSKPVKEKELLEALNYLLTDNGAQDSNQMVFGEKFPRTYQPHARLRFYGQIWDVGSYIKERNSTLGIDFKKDFPNAHWSILAKVVNKKQLNDYEK